VRIVSARAAGGKPGGDQAAFGARAVARQAARVRHVRRVADRARPTDPRRGFRRVLSGISPRISRAPKRTTGSEAVRSMSMSRSGCSGIPRASSSLSAGFRVTQGMPSVVELPKRISANPSARIARMPK
jgi:hypothetical protein